MIYSTFQVSFDLSSDDLPLPLCYPTVKDEDDMALLVVQPIDARELEQATSQWSSDRFVSLCNDLVGAVSGRRRAKLPWFTERENAADGGIDAEWEIEIADSDHALPTPIVGPG